MLAVATVLAVLALWRHWRWAFVALAAAALVLVALAVLELRASVDASSAFVSVVPGAGVILALIGAAAVVSGVIVALRPPALQLAAGLAAFAVVDRRRRRVAAGRRAPRRRRDRRRRRRPGAGDGLPRRHALHAPRPAAVRPAGAGPRVRRGRALDLRVVAGRPALRRVRADGLAFVGRHRLRLARRHRPAGLDHARRRAPDARGPPAASAPGAGDPGGRPRRSRTSSPARSRPAPTAASTSCRATPSPAGATGGSTTLAPRFGAAQRHRDRRPRRHLRRRHRQRPRAPHRSRRRRPHARGHRGRARLRRATASTTRWRSTRAAAPPSRRSPSTASGNVYMALQNVAMIVGLTPDGEMRVVAGTGPKGFGDGDGRAARARLGVVERLAVGPDGDLYVSEAERVRRIADPAGILASDPPEPERLREPPATCHEIVALNEAATGVVDGRRARGRPQRARRRRAGGDPRRRRPDRGGRHRPGRRRVRDPVRDGARRGRREPRRVRRGGVRPGGRLRRPGRRGERVLRRLRALPRRGRRRRGRRGAAAPPSRTSSTPRRTSSPRPAGTTLRELDRAAGRAVPEAEAAQVLAGVEAIDTVASAMCAAG